MTTDPATAETGLLHRLASFVLRHRRAVIAVWLLLLVGGGAASGQLSNRLKLDCWPTTAVLDDMQRRSGQY